MSKLYFRYGCMDSSKTANLLMVAHNYRSQDREVLLLKSCKDTRTSKGKIESRVGISADCIDIGADVNIIELYNNVINNSISNFECILVDESQFLSKDQVRQLACITDEFNIPIICYGLKNSYIIGKLFEGSEALLYYADKIEEIKTICSCNCDKKATMNLRVYNKKPIYDGEILNCGDTKQSEDYYIPVCRQHYFYPTKLI